MYELRAVVRTFYQIMADDWTDGHLQLAAIAVAGGSRKTCLCALKQFVKRNDRSATVADTLNDSMYVVASRKRGR